MNFELSDEQRMAVETVRRFLDKKPALFDWERFDKEDARA